MLIDTHANPDTQRDNLAPDISVYADDNVPDADAKMEYYDRSIIIVSRPVNFLEDPPCFVALLHTIGNLALPQLGYTDILKPTPLFENPQKTTDIFDCLELTLSDGSRLVLGSTQRYHWSRDLRSSSETC